MNRKEKCDAQKKEIVDEIFNAGENCELDFITLFEIRKGLRRMSRVELAALNLLIKKISKNSRDNFIW